MQNIFSQLCNLYYLLFRGVTVTKKVKPITLHHPDEGGDITLVLDIYHVEAKPRLAWQLRLLVITLLAAIITILLATHADAKSICDHHVTSGLFRHLLERGMAKSFLHGQTATGMWIGYLIVWDPNCQRAILAVYRSTGQVWNFVTHYYLDGKAGKTVRNAVAYAKTRLAREVQQIHRCRSICKIPFVPRWPEKPGFRLPIVPFSGGKEKLK
jgi:hypothetical protein